MSEVYRYEFDENGVCYRKPDGPFVSHDDYAALHYERIHDLNQIGGLQEENARLNANVERRTEQYNGIIDTQLKVIDELKAEVENSNRINTELLIISNRQASDIRRLTEAGDAMADCITEFRCGKYGNALDKVGGFYVWQDWLVAKGGKPSV